MTEIVVVKGELSPEELAALTVALLAVAAAGPAQRPGPRRRPGDRRPPAAAPAGAAVAACGCS
jgi:hypothetical protein